ARILQRHARLGAPRHYPADRAAAARARPRLTRMPPRRFTERQLVIASHNAGKVREIVELLAPYGIEIVSAAALGLPEPEETGTTFIANAELKARAAATAARLPALADDSGVVVDALDGAPGIYSARWAGPQRDFGVAMARVEHELQEKHTTN